MLCEFAFVSSRSEYFESRIIVSSYNCYWNDTIIRYATIIGGYSETLKHDN